MSFWGSKSRVLALIRYSGAPHLAVAVLSAAATLGNEDDQSRWILYAMAAIFGFLGVFLLKDAPVVTHPDPRPSSSSVRDDSQGNLIHCDTETGAQTQLFIGGITTTIAVGVSLFAYFQGITFHPFAMVLLVIALICGVSALRSIARVRKFGKSVLKYSKQPRIGSEFSGTITTTKEVPVTGDYTCVVACRETITTGSGKNRKSKTHTRWTEEKTINGKAYRSRSGIPFSFRLDEEALANKDSRAQGSVAWSIVLSAPTPGINYSVEFSFFVVAGHEKADTYDEATADEDEE